MIADPAALDAYLAYRYVPAPLSAFRAVRKLRAATYMVLDETRRRASSATGGWTTRASVGPRAPRELQRGDPRARSGAPRGRRMIADVPLGAFLSGGVDSSAVVAAMAEASHPSRSRRSRSASTTTSSTSCRTRGWSPSVFGTEHHEFVVEPDAVEILPQIVRHYGEPFADPSAIPSFYLAEMARRHVTVALNGDGGDETFAGYDRYVANALLAGPIGARRRAPAAARAARAAASQRPDRESRQPGAPGCCRCSARRAR